MYDIIFIEDENYMLDLLETAINWKEVGFHVSGKFINPKKAMKHIAENHTDAIITDIAMPYMTGIDIMKFCHANYPNIKIALISAFRDFDYAKDAIAYNVVSYLTKPVVYNELLQTAVLIKKQLDESKNDDFSMENSDLVIRFSEMISDILCGLYTKKEVLQQQFTKNEININVDKASCVILCVNIKNLNEYLENIWKYGRSRFNNALNQTLSFKIKGFYITVLKFYRNTINIIGISDCNSQNIQELIDEISERLKKFLKFDFYIEILEKFKLTQKLDSTVEKEIDDENVSINEIINGAKEYANKHYNDALMLIDVANYVHLSEIYFCSYFKKYTGMSFINYLTQVRINKAKDLLKDPQIKVSNINHMIGYKNKSHFYNTFKEYNNGLTPLEYRKLLLKETKEND